MAEINSVCPQMTKMGQALFSCNGKCQSRAEPSYAGYKRHEGQDEYQVSNPCDALGLQYARLEYS